jgi:predicted lipoprotein with Yx(FWY)xxD motif
LLAPAVAANRPRGEWSIVQRADGVRQWAFQGKPLYMYVGDVRFGDLNGMDEPGWTLATLQLPLKPPAGITLEMTAAGPVLADADGKTLYLWNCVDEAPDRGICDIPASSGISHWRSLCGPAEICAATWRPLAAPPGAEPIGSTWSVIAVDSTGAKQYAAPGEPNAVMAWAYRGRPVYTYAEDKTPGDMNGHNLRASGYWGFRRLPAGDGGTDRF